MNAIFRRIVDTFFGVEEYQELKKKGIITGFSFSALFGAEWGLVVLAQALVTFLVKIHWSEMQIFLLLWIGNMVVSSIIIIVNSKVDGDPTLMEGSRRLVDLAFKKSIIGGCIMELLYFIGLVVWAETSSFYIFFRKRLGPFPMRVITFVAVSAVKMYIWTKVYMFGVSVIDVIWNLLK
ncbi:MAG: hypothetical protein WCX17_02300 [Parcubacteria group bacterium]|jgi:hypothetical protein